MSRPAQQRTTTASSAGVNWAIVALVLLSGLLMWGYWNSLTTTARMWNNPLYSHGYLIPVFAAVLFWLRREPIAFGSMGARWAGLGLLAAALGIRMLATRHHVVTVEMLSFVPSMLGVFLMVGGWSLLRWAGPPIAFLAFMYPLPTFLKENILDRLQTVATIASTYVLQTLGVSAYNEGNTIVIGELQMGVVDACSGLRMSTNLLALAVAILMITYRPWWDRLIILLSAIPIALFVNIVRITATSLAHIAFGSEVIGDAFHDWAGFFMMPLALVILFAELEILSRLVLDEEDGAEVAAAGLSLQTGRAEPRVMHVAIENHHLVL